MQAEKANWGEGQVFVTDKVQFLMNNIIKKARKNYFGIYNKSKDPVTGREKIFVPFTEWVVETMLKNIDVDTKDIEIKATNPNAYLKAIIFRYVLKKKLDDINFGKTLNKLLRRVAIDGTGFLKALEVDGKLDVRVVDRLNMLFDPSIEDINESSGKIERHVITKGEFDELNLNNGEYVQGQTSIDRTGLDSVNTAETTTEIPYVELFERYGYWPKFCLTGKEEDRNEYVYGKAIVSGLNNSSPIVHSITEEDSDCYGNFKLKEVPNRGDGRGIPEMLFNIQAYLNEVINLRLAKGRVVHLGLFKMKGNVTPQQFKRLFTTGGIKLDGVSDIEMLNTGSIDPSSYEDEERAYTWGQRVTGTQREDEIANNRPATNALIEQQGASKSYNLRIEDLMLDMSKFIKDKMFPIIKKELKKGGKKEVIRITGDPKILEKLDKKLAENLVYDELNNNKALQLGATPEVVEGAIKLLADRQKEHGEDRFITIIDELLDEDYDIKIVITDENINRAGMAAMLKDTMGILAGAGMPIRNTIKELYDTLGLDGESLIQDLPEQPPQEAPQGVIGQAETMVGVAQPNQMTI